MPAPTTSTRLRFIDMARAVAILLMLEGHFVHMALAPEWRIKGNQLYDLWLHARGLAAPMFFTVTGLIFAFLISGAPKDQPFFKVRRVRRGLLRFAELIFWGYLLQFSPKLLTGESTITRDSWLLAFHVLQCIGLGLLSMIVVFALLRQCRAHLQASAFVVSGFAVFLLSTLLPNIEGYWPADAPAILQNIVKGPTSHFSIAPWLGFTFYGAAIGVLVQHHQTTRTGIINPLTLLLPGLLLSRIGWPADHHIGDTLLDLLGYGADNRITPFFFHARFGESLLIIGLLVCVDKWAKFPTHRFEIIGRNTFSIYVGHVIVLYGGIFGIGLNDAFRKSLNPWQAAIGAVLFCTAFIGYAQLAEPIKQAWKARRKQRLPS